MSDKSNDSGAYMWTMCYTEQQNLHYIAIMLPELLNENRQHWNGN